MTQVSYNQACCDLSHCSRSPVIFFLISFTQEAFISDTPKIAYGVQMKILLQKRAATFFLFQNANVLSIQYNDTESTCPCILQTDAYDQLHLEMIQVGKKEN